MALWLAFPITANAEILVLLLACCDRSQDGLIHGTSLLADIWPATAQQWHLTVSKFAREGHYYLWT